MEKGSLEGFGADPSGLGKKKGAADD